MDELLLNVSVSLDAPVVHRALAGVPSGITNPQAQSVLTMYGFGAGTPGGNGFCDQLIVQKVLVGTSSSTTLDFRGGTLVNVVGESNSRIATLKEFLVVLLNANDDGTATPSSGATAAFDANLATALALSAGVTVTTRPGKVFYSSDATGGSTGGSNAVLTLTNGSGTNAATWLVVAAGFRP